MYILYIIYIFLNNNNYLFYLKNYKMQLYDKEIETWRSINIEAFNGYPPIEYKQIIKIPIDLVSKLIKRNDIEKYHDKGKKEDTKKLCAICKGRLFDHSSLRLLLTCNHLYHNFCIHHCKIDFYSICPSCNILLVSEELKNCLIENKNASLLLKESSKKHKKYKNNNKKSISF